MLDKIFLAIGVLLKFFEQHKFNLQGTFIRLDKKICENRTPLLEVFQKIGTIYKSGRKSKNMKEGRRNLTQNILNIFTLTVS